MRILKIIFKSLGILLRLIPAFLSLFFQRHKGLDSFAEELKSAGINEEAVKRLTKEYKAYSTILFKLVKRVKTD